MKEWWSILSIFSSDLLYTAYYNILCVWTIKATRLTPTNHAKAKPLYLIITKFCVIIGNDSMLKVKPTTVWT